jgi:hypothetical protein
MLCPFPGGEDLVGIWWREAMGICTHSRSHTHTHDRTHTTAHARRTLHCEQKNAVSSPFAFLVCYVPGTLAAWFYSARDRRRPTAAATIATATKKKKNNNNKEKSN